jgi:hypothetical protein
VGIDEAATFVFVLKEIENGEKLPSDVLLAGKQSIEEIKFNPSSPKGTYFFSIMVTLRCDFTLGN